MESVNLHLLKPFLIALFLGALPGFERSFASRLDHEVDDYLGGIRTYSLVSLYGALASFMGREFFPELLPLAFIGIVALTVVSYYVGFVKFSEGGITTEISLAVCFMIGVTVERDRLVLAIFISITMALVLHLKEYIGRLTDRLEAEDVRATLKFAIITFIILVIDPNQTFYLKDLDPLATGLFERFPGLGEVRVINTFNVWLMVVLISGIGYSGYIATKILGARKGIGLTGLLGGLVSSTATTLTFSRRSRDEAGKESPEYGAYALAVLLACSTMFPRVVVEVLVVNPALAPRISAVMGAMAAAGFTVCFVLWKRGGSEKGDEVPLRNPFNIMPAVKFGLLYAAIVFIAGLIEAVAGDRGLYAMSVITGFSDVDAITLTMSGIAREDPSKAELATVSITLAAFSNTVMKAVIAIVLGSPRFRKLALIGFAITLLVGVAALALIVAAF
ncbi:MAG: MgtC/SapB family protein [Spirochaetes bacterium]|nr:MgtC/SapB family protein [Spirochaetota bacterium]